MYAGHSAQFEVLFAAPVEMGSWLQMVGQAFNALTMGRSSRADRIAWARSMSGSSGSLSGAEPSCEELSATETCVLKKTGGADASPRSGPQHLVRQRTQYSLQEQKDLGAEACKFRDEFFEEHGRMYGWLKAFLRQRLHIDDDRLPAAKAASRQVKCAVRTAQGGLERELNPSGQTLSYGFMVPSRFRKRRRGGGRRVLCPIISEELWSWFVDRLKKCPARVGTQLLIDQANLVSADVYDDWLVRRAQCQADATCPPTLPEITSNWVQRWRKAYGVTFRTVNLRYKISQSKRLHRLRVFWSNVLRVRLLHECL